VCVGRGGVTHGRSRRAGVTRRDARQRTASAALATFAKDTPLRLWLCAAGPEGRPVGGLLSFFTMTSHRASSLTPALRAILVQAQCTSTLPIGSLRKVQISADRWYRRLRARERTGSAQGAHREGTGRAQGGGGGNTRRDPTGTRGGDGRAAQP
jgi:hypothetical protein